MSWDFLQSRAFWTGLGPVIVAFCNLIGHPLGDEKAQALAVILSAIAGWVGVTASRLNSGNPSSRSGVMRLLRAQEAEIERLNRFRGDH